MKLSYRVKVACRVILTFGLMVGCIAVIVAVGLWINKIVT